ncbi:hypothetical protein O9929_05630 [Vibrio lentus]|nr:hypothetical protein [Vibrio lentus]
MTTPVKQLKQYASRPKEDQGFTVVGFPTTIFRQDRGSEESASKFVTSFPGSDLSDDEARSNTYLAAALTLCFIQQQAIVTPK